MYKQTNEQEQAQDKNNAEYSSSQFEWCHPAVHV